MGLNFKTYIPQTSTYKGGKSKDEVETAGMKIHKMSSNENPLGASPKALDAVKEYSSTISEYPSPVDLRFRSKLSEFYKGVLSPDQFITTNSGVANIELIIRGFLDEDSECIYCSPYFNAYKDFSEMMGAKTIDVPLLGKEFNLDIAGIDAAITERTSVLFITSPNNPTGSYIPKSQVDQLMGILPEHVLLVFDEVYYQYADAEDYVRALPYVLAHKNVIAVNSFSKAYGLAGLRIGYSYASEEVATYLRKFRIPFMLNTLSMEAAIAAMQDDEFIERTVTLIHKEKHYLYKELDRIGLEYWKTQANFILVRPTMTPLQFEASMIEEGVMVRPLVGFGAPDCVRVTIGMHEANEAFINALKKIS